MKPQTLRGLLVTGYRLRYPVLGFSALFVLFLSLSSGWAGFLLSSALLVCLCLLLTVLASLTNTSWATIARLAAEADADSEAAARDSEDQARFAAAFMAALGQALGRNEAQSLPSCTLQRLTQAGATVVMVLDSLKIDAIDREVLVSALSFRWRPVTGVEVRPHPDNRGYALVEVRCPTAADPTPRGVAL